MHFRSDENRKPEITYVFAGHWNSSECVKLTLLIHFEIFCNLFPKRHLLWGKFFNSSCWSFILRRNVLDKIWLINIVRMKLSSFWEISLLAKRILAWRETANGNHVGVGGPMRIEWLCVWVMFSTHFDVFCDQQLKTELFGIKNQTLPTEHTFGLPYSSQKNQANIIFKTARHERMLLKRGRRSLNDARLLSMQTMILRSVRRQ